MDYTQFTIEKLRSMLDQKEISAVELTQGYLDRIAQYDNTIQSYITVTPELALEQAKAAQKKIDAGEGSILCGIPLLAIGIVGAMLLTGKTFTFCAIVGALGLVGMMMKNCIVLMDEIGAQIAAGADPASALVSSSESRLRPVMMASLTTILGMIPLLGDAMFGSMAATIMGGLLFSTFATLFFVPVLYAMFFKIRIDR